MKLRSQRNKWAKANHKEESPAVETGEGLGPESDRQ